MSNPPSPRRAEHLGSLLRPTVLLDALQNDTDPQTQEEIQNREINIIVQDQLALGFDVVNDGEYRRSCTRSRSPPSFYFESVSLIISE